MVDGWLITSITLAFYGRRLNLKLVNGTCVRTNIKLIRPKCPPSIPIFLLPLYLFTFFVYIHPVPPSTPPGCRLASFFSQDPHFDNSQYFSHFIPTFLRRLQLIVFFFLNSYRVQTYSFIFIFQFSIF